MGFSSCIKKSVSDIDTQSEGNIANEMLNDADSSFFGASDEKDGTTAKKSAK